MESTVFDPYPGDPGTIPPAPRPGSTLLASARRLTSKDVTSTKARRRVQPTPWQSEARDMFRLVGEFQYIVSTLAGRVGQAKLYIGKVSQADPSADPERVDNDQDVLDILQTLGGTYAGRSQLLRRLAINLLVPGDGWLCGVPRHISDPANHPTPEPGTAIPLASLDWKMLSIEEVSLTQDSLKLQLSATGEATTVTPEQVYLIRIWNPDPFHWLEATSSARSNLPVLKELVGLTMHVSAQVDSRLAGAGILIVPQSAQRALQAAAGIEEGSNTDEFTEALIEAMLTPIADRGSAAAVVPLVVTVPDDAAEKFQHIKFSSPLDEAARELREEAIRRLALGMDAPPEVLLGSSDASHWAAWFQDADTIRSHVEPMLALICDAITTQYLWPVLEEQGKEDYRDYVVWYDVSHLISRPNRGQDAMAMYDKGAISESALRRELGFDEDDAPATDDPVKAAIMEMVQSNPGMLRSPALPQMIEALQLIMDGKLDELGRKAEEDAAERRAASEREDESEPAAVAPAAPAGTTTTTTTPPSPTRRLPMEVNAPPGVPSALQPVSMGR